MKTHYISVLSLEAGVQFGHTSCGKVGKELSTRVFREGDGTFYGSYGWRDVTCRKCQQQLRVWNNQPRRRRR